MFYCDAKHSDILRGSCFAGGPVMFLLLVFNEVVSFLNEVVLLTFSRKKCSGFRLFCPEYILTILFAHSFH